MMYFKQPRRPRVHFMGVHTAEITIRARILLKEPAADHLVPLNREMSAPYAFAFPQCVVKPRFLNIAHNACPVVCLKLCISAWE